MDGQASSAHFGDQALPNDPADCFGEALPNLFFLLLLEHTDDAVDRLAGVHRVQGAHHQVARLRGFQAQLDRLAVAHLADENDLRRLPEGGPEAAGERVKVTAQLPLVKRRLDVGMHELDRVFQCDDVDGFGLIKLPQQRRQRGGFAAAGGPADQDQAVLLLRHLEKGFRQVQALQRWNHRL